MSGLDDNTGRLRMLFAQEDEGQGSQVCKIKWEADSGILLDNTIVWNGGPPSQSGSWDVSDSPTPGEV